MCMHCSQHPNSKPHRDDVLYLSPNVNSPTMCTLGATPALCLSTNTTLTPTTCTVDSSISRSVTTASSTASTIVKSPVSEDAADKVASAASDVNEYESALQNLRRRRLALKQQQEQSSRQTDNVCHPTTSTEGTVPISSHLPDQPLVLVDPNYSDERQSSHLNMDATLLPNSRPTDSNFNANYFHSKGPTLSPSSTSSSGNFPSRIESVSSQVPVSTSSIGTPGSSTSPGKTSFTQYSYKLEKFHEHLCGQGNSDDEINANLDYLVMKEEERKQQACQIVSTDCSHMDIPQNYEQRLDHQKSEETLSHRKYEQENLTYESANCGMLTTGVQHVHEDEKQWQMLIANKVSHMHT